MLTPSVDMRPKTRTEAQSLMSQNKYAAAAYQSRDISFAVPHCCMLINQQLAQTTASQPPDLVLVFVAGYSPDVFETAMRRISELTKGRTVMGVTCQSLVAGGQEFEDTMGISIWAACWPEAQITPMTLELQTENGQSSFSGLPDAPWADDSVLIMFSEAYSFPADGMLEHLNNTHPGLRVLGGVSDSGLDASNARLMLNGEVYAQGAVAVRISGIEMQTVVSQGCRPIGDGMIVTDADRNVIASLGGRPAFAIIKEIYATLPTQDKARVERGLHLGIAMSELKDVYQYGDFLIRNVIGIDEQTQSITISDYIRKGRTVKFHIRDQFSASTELRNMLKMAINGADRLPQGALVFTCNGRGSHLFEQPHHDASLVKEVCGDIPASGFFAAGEFGYVGRANYLHGFTASIALFK